MGAKSTPKGTETKAAHNSAQELFLGSEHSVWAIGHRKSRKPPLTGRHPSGADYMISSHDPQALLTLLADRFDAALSPE
jgi:hypothetical protein